MQNYLQNGIFDTVKNVAIVSSITLGGISGGFICLFYKKNSKFRNDVNRLWAEFCEGLSQVESPLKNASFQQKKE